MRYASLLLAVGLIALASCARETKNVGGPPDPCRFTVSGITLSPVVPSGGYVAGTDVTATVHFAGCTAPYTITLEATAGISPLTQTVIVDDQDWPTSATFTIHLDEFLLIDDPDGRDIGLTAHAQDANGTLANGTGSLHVVGIPDQLTTISAIANPDCSVTVTVSDPDNEDVTINASTVPAELTSNTGDQVVAGGNGSADFSFRATDFLAGGSGDIVFTATTAGDPVGRTASVSLSCPPIALAADTLYAIPLKTTIKAGERVTILVATGAPAHPFRYLTGVRLTIPQAADALYVGGTRAAGGTGDVPGSFNAGAVGGAAMDVDGYWTVVGASVFLLPPDNFFQRSVAGNGLHGFDYNLTPLDGNDVTSGSGELFNLQLEFPNPGTWKLGFQDLNVVSRTYYQDGNQAPDYFWGDISNEHEGIPNSVTVL